MNNMTFDGIIPTLLDVLKGVERPKRLILNLDLLGKLRILVDENDPDAFKAKIIAENLQALLGRHSYPVESSILEIGDFDSQLKDASVFQFDEMDGVYFADRLSNEGRWAPIQTSSHDAPRIVFYSIKGGVGRSTALAAASWVLAEKGKRVLVIDLDLESPGISSSLLPESRRPVFGVTDWLVEELVGNEEAVFADMVATSTLSRNGDILVVPAHGKDPGRYISKIGRVWMPVKTPSGKTETWPTRLSRLVDALQNHYKPDVVLIDSRAGIDEVASACLSALGADLILLFAIDGEQTWSGYRILFNHWVSRGVAKEIREHLQMIGSMIPETDTLAYQELIREHSWNLFVDELYDEVPAVSDSDQPDRWSFDEADPEGPHYPWVTRWNRGFASLYSLYSKLDRVDPIEIDSVYGSMIRGIYRFLGETPEVS